MKHILHLAETTSKSWLKINRGPPAMVLAHLENTNKLRRTDCLRLKNFDKFLEQWPLFKVVNSYLYVSSSFQFLPINL